METGTSIDNTGYEGIKNGSWFIQFRNGCNPWMARYVYGLIFLLANLLAWALRDYGRGALTEMRKFKNCKEGGDCLGTEGVLRVSFGCFLFYFIMFLSTVGTSKTHSSRDKWHSGWWFAKLFMLLGLTIFPFLLPSSIIQFYGKIKANHRLRFIVFRYQTSVSMTKWLFLCFLGRGDCPFWCRVRFIF
jgi:hypothetical protein